MLVGWSTDERLDALGLDVGQCSVQCCLVSFELTVPDRGVVQFIDNLQRPARVGHPVNVDFQPVALKVKGLVEGRVNQVVFVKHHCGASLPWVADGVIMCNRCVS